MINIVIIIIIIIVTSALSHVHVLQVPDSAIVASKPGWDLDSTAFFTEDKRTEFWKDFEKCRTTQ